MKDIDALSGQSTNLARDVEFLLQHRFERRKLLRLAGIAGVLSAHVAAQSRGYGMFSGQEEPILTAEGPDGPCMNFTSETSGPYPADGTVGRDNNILNVLDWSGVVRRDLRSDVDDPGQRVGGVGLVLDLKLVDVNKACQPLAGHAIYLWHCDAVGNYSLYSTPDRSWLRGVQVTDGNGIARFLTIFPGAYSGRYPHIHFEVFSSLENATSGRQARLISQLAMPQQACINVYQGAAYKGSRSTFGRTNSAERDSIFGNNGAQRIPVMTLNGEGNPESGYSMGAVIGLA